MRRAIFANLFLFVFLFQAEGALKLAFVESLAHNKGAQSLKGQLKRIGFPGSDVTEKAKSSRFSPGSYKAFLVGAQAMSDRALQKWFRREANSLRDFINRGGVLICFIQNHHEWDIAPWLPQKAFLLRGGANLPGADFIEAAHPIFQEPSLLSLETLNSAKLSLKIFRSVKTGVVLASHKDRPWCVEMGWGKGRCLFINASLELKDKDQTQAQQKIMDGFLKNILTYASKVSRGSPHPLPESARISGEEVEEKIFLKDFKKEQLKAQELEVNKAVDKAVAWLLKKQKEDGSWGRFSDGWGSKYETGLTAIALLALLNSGVNKYKKPIEKGFEFMMAHPPVQNYEVALSLLALEMKAAPMYERFNLAKLHPKERENHKFVRTLSPEERVFMEDLVEILLSYKSKGGCWRYNGSQGQNDISNGQFAVLGLKAASRCDIKIPMQVWEEVFEYYLDFQAKEGPKVKHKEFKSFSKHSKPEFKTFPAQARGWGYHHGYPKPGSTVGSHVNIGLSCLLLAYEELVKRRSPVAAKRKNEMKRSIRDGLAWLCEHWCVDARPNGDKFYYHYYIYSLGRVGVLIDNRFIGEHDWYREAAAYLLEKQAPDGHWGIRSHEWGSNISATAFTLLFLMRSTPPPVITLGK